MWADRIRASANVIEKVKLHVERWKAWDEFIYNFANGKTIESQVFPITIDENDTDESKFQHLLQAMEIRWSKKIVGNVIFDASFGSLNSTSDLDINVLSPDTEVLEQWVIYIQEWHTSHDETFTNYYDSNFYFEPCDKSMQSLKLLLVNTNFEWTTENSYIKEFETVKNYTEAYKTNKEIEGISPNPQQMDKVGEINYYTKCKKLAGEFTNAYNSGNAESIRESYLKFAVCKIEGIISIPALAICGVFGPEVRRRFIQKDVDIHPKALEIGVYEMLCNLRMHAHDGNNELKFKSKYANRLINLLQNNKNICAKTTVLTKRNDATMDDIKLAMVFLFDYLDGHQCKLDTYKNTKYNINDVIKILGSRIHPEQTTITRVVIQLRF